MKGMVFTGKDGVLLQSVPDPVLEDQNGAIVKVTECSICGSDSGFYRGANVVSEDTGFCVGHEAVGEVAELGSDVRRLKIGDKVMLSGYTSKPCGLCATCKAGDVFSCHRQQVRIYGNSLDLHGGQAEGIAVPDADVNATKVPDGVSSEQALLLTDTLATAYFACENAAVRPGSTVAVIGLGPIGLMCIELAFIFGASRVFAMDLIEYRRDEALQLGAIPLDPANAAEAISEATEGQMIGAVIDTAGGAKAIKLATDIAANQGIVSTVAVEHGVSFGATTPFPHLDALVKSLTYRTALSIVPRAWPHLIPLLQHGRIQPERVFSHRLGLADGEHAYRLFMERLDNTVKVVLNP